MVDEKSKSAKNHLLLWCGFGSGLIQSVIFNPWDRALYLSVKNDRNFLHALNFEKPMTGVFQTAIHRAISSGLYFPLEDIFSSQISKSFEKEKNTSPSVRALFSGMLAGAVNGFILNPASRIKYYYWGKVDCGRESFFDTAFEMYRKAGFRPFFIGATATITRDIVFGGTYAVLKALLKTWRESDCPLLPDAADHDVAVSQSTSKQRQEQRQVSANMESFLINMTSASIATIFSSPLNYVRNVNYSSDPSQGAAAGGANRLLPILRALYAESMTKQGWLQRLRFLQRRLRVAVGMGVGSQLYNSCTIFWAHRNTED